jgi:hypothetical protein
MRASSLKMTKARIPAVMVTPNDQPVTSEM